MIPSLKLIHDRCKEVGDCLLWQQGVGGRPGSPIMSLSASQRGVSVRRMVWEFTHGPIPRGWFVYPTCGQSRCLACLACGTRGDYMRNAARFGSYSTPAVRLSRARGMQSISKLTWDDVRSIRAERAAGGSLRKIAAKYGISFSSVSHIALGRQWRECAAGSSVFQMETRS